MVLKREFFEGVSGRAWLCIILLKFFRYGESQVKGSNRSVIVCIEGSFL